MQTSKGIVIPRTEFKAIRTGLGSKIGLYKDNSFAFSFSFILDEVLEMIETPRIEPSVEFFAHKPIPTLSYSFKVFQNDNICVLDNLFAYEMVDVPHIAFLPSRKQFELSLTGFCAFALQPSPQVLELHNLGLTTLENPAIRTDSKVVYSDINTQMKSIRNGLDIDISGKCDVKEESALFVNSQKGSLVTPIKIFKIIFWNLNRNINPLSNGGESDFILTESKSPLIKSKRHHFLKSWFRAFICFDRFKGLRSYPIGIYNKLRGQIKQFSCLVIAKMMEFVSVGYIGFKAFISNILDRFTILLHSFKKQSISWYFDFDSCYGLHNLNVGQLIYKPYAQMSSGINRGWQFLPLLKQGVSLPYEL